MSKALKRSFAYIILAMAFAFAGLFLFGCDDNSQNVTISSSVSSVDLEIGESEEITFTINNANDNFAKTLKFNEDNSGVISKSGVTYNGNEAKITVTGLRGGTTNLMAVTEEGYKYITVRINVIQHSTTLAFDQTSLYVSNSTPLMMNNGYYNFDSNTTDKDMSFYYLLDDVTGMTFSKFTDEGLEFVDDETTRIAVIDAVEFDTARINDDGTALILSLNGVDYEETQEIFDSFNVLAVYDYSENYANYLSCMHEVQVLQDLGVKVYGGYLQREIGQDGTVYENVEFEELSGDEILIIPNSDNYEANSYVLKIEAQNKSDLIEYGYIAENSNIDVDEYNLVEPDVDYSSKTVVYYKIQSSTTANIDVNLHIYLRYSSTKDASDQSVNFNKDYNINIDFAPKEILVNGESATEYSSQDNPLILYNRYTYPEFGWQNIQISVTSGIDAEPIFSYAYITFEENDLRFKYGQIEISSDRNVTDLSTSFQFKGRDYAAVTAVGQVKSFTINVVYETLGNEISLQYIVYYRIVNGATRIVKNIEYGQGNVIYLDYEEHGENGAILDNYLFADQLFQSFTTEFVSGNDVVDFEVPEVCYIEREGNYYLNFSVKAKGAGQGTYNVTLDNGTSQQVTFSVIETLKDYSTSINISNVGNIGYYERLKSDESLNYYDILNLEILNPTIVNNNEYEILFGSTAEITFRGNINGTMAVGDDKDVISYLNFNGVSYHFETVKNGTSTMTITVSGNVVNSAFQRDITYLDFTINFVSYSLLDEFILLNNGNYAVDNIVYYGDSDYIPEEDEMVDFEISAKNSEAYNFYRYSMNESFFINNNIIQDIIDEKANEITIGEYEVLDSDVSSKLVSETYNDKFVYYYVDSTNFGALTTTTTAHITVNVNDETFYYAYADLSFANGFMFYADEMSFVYDEDNNITVTITFDNAYMIESYGEYDLKTLTYTNISNNYGNNGLTFTLHAYVRQRDYSQMRYDANIIASRYIQVQDISSASPIEELVFTNSELTQSFIVTVTPTTATNTTLRAEFVPLNDTSSNLIDCTIVEQGLGTYLVEISAERFYNTTANITDIIEKLAGTVYVYPIEWGDSYSVIPTENNPIIVGVSYRNGSESNRYILETPADILAINANEKSLSSHYEIKNNIDMSTVEGSPIGILETSEGFKLVGFSGSIVGTSSQAGISNVHLTTVGGTGSIKSVKPMDETYNYSGLFALINETGYIKNLTITGSMNLDITENQYAGLLAGVNRGNITNVSARITNVSNVHVVDGAVNSFVQIGALVGANFGNQININEQGQNVKIATGNIIQYFPAYNQEEFNGTHTRENVAGEFSSQSTKNIAYFTDKLIISLPSQFSGNLYVGGIAGYNSGDIKKIDDSSLKIYGYATYSSYANIEIQLSGNQTQGKIYAGGAVGYAISNPVSEKPTLISGLTVGGEVDLQNDTQNSSSAVGGIVGFATIAQEATGAGTQPVQIYNNISRTFLRGEQFVGGILGYDNYQGYATSANGQYVSYKDENNQNSINKVEAVDDGRSVLEASMMILRSNSIKLGKGTYSDDIIIAIGNAENAGRQLEDIRFTISSYITRAVVTGENVVVNDNATTKYYGEYLILNGTEIKQTSIELNPNPFTKIDVNIGLTGDEFKLTPKNDITNALNVYLSYYFQADSFLSGQTSGVIAQDVIDDFNVYETDSNMYPFTINTRDAEIISSSTDILNVDLNGNLTVHGTGLATLKLQSILNIQETINVYLYIVNYFNKDTTESIYYSSDNSNGLNIVNGSQINVYGNKQTSIYAVPTYEKDEEILPNGSTWSISKDGVLRYANTSVLLTKNTSLKTDVTLREDSEGYTRYQISGEQIIFYGNNKGEGIDKYNLDSYIMVEIDGVPYIMEIGKQDIAVDVQYLETATNIYTSSTLISMQTNDKFDEKLFIESKNKEYAYYQIIFTDEYNNESIVQSRLDATLSVSEDGWKNYVNDIGDDLFNLTFTRLGDTNTFDFNISVNKNSSAYANRNVDNIFGNYRIIFYGNELEEGVSCVFSINLSEAEITNVSAFNYSNIKDMAIADEVIVPSQYGILEINIDPVEAEFNTFTIKNNAINYNTGAGEVAFTFAYQSVDETGVVTYVADTNFGENRNGSLTFTYQELMKFLQEKDAKYNGKIYVRYFLGSMGVEDGAQIGFDINVTYGDGLSFEIYKPLTTKLANYVKLTFDNREESDTYYVARGLNYGMTLDYYGFSLSDIQITVSDERVATLTGQNTSYSLNITPNEINYTGDVGYLVNIYIYASRVVDNVTVEYSDILTVYVMEYVFNYNYAPGINEDIVEGMENGVISTAVGNAYKLQLDIWDFMEYDQTNESVVQNVETFIERLMQSVKFSISDSSTGIEDEELEVGKEIRSNYYYIKDYTFTGIRLYEPEQNVYTLKVDGTYSMLNGVYICEESTTLEQQTLHTNFAFSIHQQSTDESPLPIESYEDFLEMEAGEYYILLNDITLPNEDNLDYEQFKPITTQIAGFDGNGYTIFLGGDYQFTAEESVIGLFAEVEEDVVIKNVTIEIYANTNFVMEATTFSIGLLVSNNAGIITNCEVRATNDSVLSVTYRNTTTNSYLAGLVASNTGMITNSRTMVDLYTNVNLSGFVGTNSGIIASSYFRNGSLKNETNGTTEYTAGFALQNTGSIYTSYVSGEVADNDQTYYKGKDDYILSDNTIAGFVFTNSGLVENCYTNINLQGAGSFSSGFVFVNEEGGQIMSSYSTSVLTSNNTQSYGFARTSNGYISDCYWLSQEAGEEKVTDQIVYTNEAVNVSISTIENNENNTLKSLTAGEFNINHKDFKENFKNFIYSSSRGYNSVWFYNNVNSSSTFNGSTFNTERLELVAPNIVAFSQKYLYSAEEITDEETGVTIVVYNYVNTEESGISGSVYNPILIDDAESFENYILNENDANNYNNSYYRLINDIDYSELTINSELYKTRFMGYIEGNFMTISNINMVTSENLQFAGLFAEVGSSSRVNAIGTLMNFTLEPNEMVFTNTQVAGTIAGKFDNGTIANINVVSDDNIMVTGKNVVGGLVGVALGNYKISNVSSQISAKASYIVSEGENNFNSNSVVYQYYSFAGSVVGVASGSGLIDRVLVESDIGVVGAKAGGMFGFVDQNVTASNLTLNVTENLKINAYNYGGLIAGESAGNFDTVAVNGIESDNGGFSYLQIFSLLPYVPTAVGGISGLVSGGNLSNIYMSQSLELSKVTSTSGIDNVGGIAGIIQGRTTISNADVNAGLVGFHIVGGFVGTILGGNFDVEFNDINYQNGYLSILSTQQTNAYAGGVVGFINGSANVKISSTLGDATLKDMADKKEKHISVNPMPEGSSLSTDIFTSENYNNEANHVDFELMMTTYVYNSAFSNFIGGLIGLAGSGSVVIENTISNIKNANIQSLDMGISGAKLISETASVASTTFTYKVNNEDLEGYAYSLNHTVTNPAISFIGDSFGYTKGTFGVLPISTNSDDDETTETSSLATTPAPSSVIPIYSYNITFSYNQGESGLGTNFSYALQVNSYGIMAGQPFFANE